MAEYHDITRLKSRITLRFPMACGCDFEWAVFANTQGEPLTRAEAVELLTTGADIIDVKLCEVESRHKCELVSENNPLGLKPVS